MEKESNPTVQHSMKCPKLYGEDCKCDGYHTFDELYDHRIVLYITLCKKIVEGLARRSQYEGIIGEFKNPVWRSQIHHDGTGYEGWFIMGIRENKGEQISYHLPMKDWENTEFAETLKTAPEFDGHTSQDVLERIKSL